MGGTPATQYVIRGQAGQTLLTALTDNPPGNVNIAVRDAAGNTLNFGRAPTELGTRLSATGDYLITLDTAGAAVNYRLTVTVPPLPGAATRIIFPIGATSTTVTGDLPFGGGANTWVIGAMAGQTMTASLVATTPGWLSVFVYSPAGDLIAVGRDPAGVVVPLSAGGDYTIVVFSDPAAGPISYSMVVTIP